MKDIIRTHITSQTLDIAAAASTALQLVQVSHDTSELIALRYLRASEFRELEAFAPDVEWLSAVRRMRAAQLEAIEGFSRSEMCDWIRGVLESGNCLPLLFESDSPLPEQPILYLARSSTTMREMVQEACVDLAVKVDFVGRSPPDALVAAIVRLVGWLRLKPLVPDLLRAISGGRWRQVSDADGESLSEQAVRALSALGQNADAVDQLRTALADPSTAVAAFHGLSRQLPPTRTTDYLTAAYAISHSDHPEHLAELTGALMSATRGAYDEVLADLLPRLVENGSPSSLCIFRELVREVEHVHGDMRGVRLEVSRNAEGAIIGSNLRIVRASKLSADVCITLRGDFARTASIILKPIDETMAAPLPSTGALEQRAMGSRM